MKIAALSFLGVLALFLIYVSTREGKFNYSVTGQVNAPVEKVFPYLSDLKRGGEWSPFERQDPQMKKEYIGARADQEVLRLLRLFQTTWLNSNLS